MKDNYPRIGLSRFCRLLGITRQAYYKHFWYRESESIEQSLVLDQIRLIRKTHRRMGTRKLYELLQNFMLEHQIKMGRDALFDLLATNNLLVRRKRKNIYTTNSFHWLRKYPNLIKEMKPTAINQLWVSDITYLKISSGFAYISFVTDAYSRKIIGYHIAPNLDAVETLQALKMALSQLNKTHEEIIHHSDRGIQYCSSEYVNLLMHNKIKISMTENGDPLENSIAERVNGILKEEYLEHYTIQNIQQARELLDQAVKLYNRSRPHFSIGLLTPESVHQHNLKTERLWKNRYVKPTAPNHSINEK
jgi:transposase InsO family protein